MFVELKEWRGASIKASRCNHVNARMVPPILETHDIDLLQAVELPIPFPNSPPSITSQAMVEEVVDVQVAQSERALRERSVSMQDVISSDAHVGYSPNVPRVISAASHTNIVAGYTSERSLMDRPRAQEIPIGATPSVRQQQRSSPRQSAQAIRSSNSMRVDVNGNRQGPYQNSQVIRSRNATSSGTNITRQSSYLDAQVFRSRNTTSVETNNIRHALVQNMQAMRTSASVNNSAPSRRQSMQAARSSNSMVAEATFQNATVVRQRSPRLFQETQRGSNTTRTRTLRHSHAQPHISPRP